MKYLFGFLIAIPFCLPAQSQVTISDVTLPRSLMYEGAVLDLNGGGLREKYWLDLYVGGLYTQSQTNNPDTVILKDEPMAIRLHIVSSLIDSEKMEEATDEGFNHSMKGNTAPLQAKINTFKDVFREEIKVGDIYDLFYTPEYGTQIYKNGVLSQTIKGLNFKQALFGIWFGKTPAQEELKAGMLGLAVD